MAASTQRATEQLNDELTFHNDAVSLCLLVNRRHKTVRVIDFRAGATVAKRNFVIQTARREGLEKVYVLVERDEVFTWSRLGFRREGSVPGFYRRSDAWIMGAVVGQVGPMKPERAYDSDDDDDLDDEPSPAVELAEKLMEKSKRLAKETADKAVPTAKIAPIRREAAMKAVLAAQAAGRALTGFERFSRDAERSYAVVTAKGNFELVASWEMQPSFGSSLLEILTGPRDESERMLTVAAVRALMGRLAEIEAVSTFVVAPADDIALGSCFAANGFRRSAVLASHVELGGKRHDAILWAKKLADN